LSSAFEFHYPSLAKILNHECHWQIGFEKSVLHLSEMTTFKIDNSVRDWSECVWFRGGLTEEGEERQWEVLTPSGVPHAV